MAPCFTTLCSIILVRSMRHLLVLLVLFAMQLRAGASVADDRAATILMKRAIALTSNPKGCYLYIPPRGDFAKHVGKLGNAIPYAAARHEPLIIYSPNAQWATRITTMAFAVIRPDALRGCTIICAVGKKNDAYIRPVIEATGARLYVEPLP
jgi:hypothetical protein